MNDSRDFQDAESVRSGHSHVTSQPVSFPLHPIPGGMLSRNAEPQEKGRQAFGTRMVFRETFFLQFQWRLLQHLSAGIESVEFIDRRAAPLIHSGEK